MNNGKITLTTLKTKLRKKEDIQISNNKVIDIKELVVTKNNGEEDKFSFKEIETMALSACDDNKDLCKILLEETSIKLYNRIKTSEIQEQLIKTAENLISRLQPQWEYIAAKLFLKKLYKETYNIDGYPLLDEFLKKGIKHKILDFEIFNSYSPAEIMELNAYMDSKRDFIFTIKGIKIFASKYILRTPGQKKKLELPQLSYMRVAMALHWKRSQQERMERVKRLYDLISKHHLTLATPIMLNAGTINMQLSSCVLNAVADDSISIMDVNKDLAIYSKFKGGTSLDIDEIRSSDTYIEGNQGISSGPVPFVKITEQIMKAWNQGCVSKNNYVKRIKTITKDKKEFSVQNFISYFGKKPIEKWAQFRNVSSWNEIQTKNEIEIQEEEILITELQINDYVKSFDLKKKDNHFNKVLDIIYPTVEKKDQMKITISFSNTTIITSKTHPMCVYDDIEGDWGYIPSENVKNGTLIKSEGRVYVVNDVDLNYSENSDFIDFTIERDNNYYVSNTKDEYFVIHNSKRPGSCAVYFSFWHYNFEELVVLKNNGGIEENRARGLKYAVKFNKFFIDRWFKNEDITLFNPKEVPLLLNTFGKEWDEAYLAYEKKTGIQKKKINARELWLMFIKERSETGNIYLFWIDNVNYQNMLGQMVKQSNLCLDGETTVKVLKNVSVDLLKNPLSGNVVEKDMKLKDVKVGDFVKCYDLDTDVVEYSEIRNFSLTSPSSEVYRISDEKGNSIVCTADHKIFTKNRGYVEASQLNSEDELLIDNH